MPEDTGIKAYASLGDDVNKLKKDGTQETTEGVVGQKLPELTLEMPDADIIKLTDAWEKEWKDSPKKAEWESQIDENEKYWLGKQYDSLRGDKSRAMVDNLIFESLETYLPTITRRNPEPIVSLDASERGEDGSQEDPVKTKYVQKLKARLADLADKNKLRLKLKKAARHWAIMLIGVAKFGWDLDRNMPIVRIVRAKKIILDPEAITDEDGYTGGRIGEYRKMEASKIIAIIGDDPSSAKAKKAVEDLVKDKEGTDLQFIEWWTPQYMCWKMGREIIFKKKNPHWNYDRTETPEITDMASEGVQVDDYGNATAQPIDIKGINHFSVPEMPYRFLTVFNLGDQPMDKTSLIGQNLANQDLINKRNKQIDKNADRMNGGMVVSLGRSGLTQGQAKGVSEALRKGGVVVIPDGAPREAIDDFQPSALPADVFMQLEDTRARMRDIFGIRGSSAAGLETEQTVRGKIMNKGTDSDRSGGGVSEYLEQFADDIYNWFVQLLYVYDTAFQFVQGATPPKVLISVKEGSLLPKDSISIANQAIELGTGGKMALIDMYKRLEYPNPDEMAANVWLEANAPHLLYKDNPMVQQAIMMQQQAAQAQAQAEAEKAGLSHGQTMEKEKMKGEMKMENDMQNSILSAVPSQ